MHDLEDEQGVYTAPIMITPPAPLKTPNNPICDTLLCYFFVATAVYALFHLLFFR